MSTSFLAKWWVNLNIPLFCFITIPRGRMERKACPYTILKTECFQFNFKHKCLNHPYIVILWVSEHFNASLLPSGLFYMISDILPIFFCCFDKRNKMYFMIKSIYVWSASLTDARGNLIKRVFIEFNTENKAKKVSTESKLPWKCSKSFLFVCLYLISLIFTWKRMLLWRKGLYLKV